MTRMQCLQVAGVFLLGCGTIALTLYLIYKRRLAELDIDHKVTRRAPVQRKVLREINKPNLRAHVRQWTDAQDRVTELVALLPAGAQWLTVRTPNWNVLTPFGGLDVPLAPSFRVTTNDEMYATRFLDDPTRSDIKTLSHEFAEALFLDIRPGQFVVRVREPAASVPRTEEFVERAIRLASRAVSVIQAMPAGTVQGEVGGCAVCGKTVAPVRQLLCPVCRTPHHRECWAYNEGCSRLGCGEGASGN